MHFLEAYSSVVLVGNNFAPSLFKAEKHADLLGEPDSQNLIVTPIVSRMLFPTTGFTVFISPDRIDLGYTKADVLPEPLRDLATRVAETLVRTEVGTCAGVGVNLNATVAASAVGGNALEYCRRTFLRVDDIEKRLACDAFVVNTAKLVFDKDAVRYSMDVEPHFASGGSNLHLKINAHQNVGDAQAAVHALARFDMVKDYLQQLPEKLLGEQR